MKKTTMEDIKVARQELKYCLIGTGGSFTTSLFHTISKADPHNLSKLGTVFPAEVFVYMEETGFAGNYMWDIDGRLYLRNGACPKCGRDRLEAPPGNVMPCICGEEVGQ